MRVLHDARFLPSFDLLQAVAREEVLTLQARELPLFSPSPPLVLSFLLLRLHWGTLSTAAVAWTKGTFPLFSVSQCKFVLARARL